MNRGAAAATDVGAGNAAREVVGAWGSASDALVAGWFALAGSAPEGLFAPLIALVAGPGSGARVFDGRALQPGLGLGRPRGFQNGDVVPDAARASVPRALGALALLHSQRGRVSFSRLADAGVALAKDAGAPARAETIRRVAAEGPTALSRDRIRHALLAAAGPLARGAMTEQDLAEARADDVAAQTDLIEEAAVVTPGNLLTAATATALVHAGRLEAIAAVDAQGVAACLVAWIDAPGLLVPELEVALPLGADPVRRGIPRTPPGSTLALPAPLAIVERQDLRIAVAGIHAGILALEDLIALAGDPTLDTGLARLSARGGSIAVVSDPRGGRVVIGAAI